MTLPDLPPTALQASAFTMTTGRRWLRTREGIAGARILRGLPIPERA